MRLEGVNRLAVSFAATVDSFTEPNALIILLLGEARGVCGVFGLEGADLGVRVRKAESVELLERLLTIALLGLAGLPVGAGTEAIGKSLRSRR